jgi:hypothetical protein
MKEIAKDAKDGDKKKDEKKDDKKKDDKKDDKDKKEEEKPATGPEWDPLDVLGAASLGDEVGLGFSFFLVFAFSCFCCRLAWRRGTFQILNPGSRMLDRWRIVWRWHAKLSARC